VRHAVIGLTSGISVRGKYALSEARPVSPLQPRCAACDTRMQLDAVEPHPDYGSAFELHGFRCPACGRTQSYTLRRKPIFGRAASQPAGERRSRRSR
jgi:hypothetical protein